MNTVYDILVNMFYFCKFMKNCFLNNKHSYIFYNIKSYLL